MNSHSADVIVVGAGHNGLVAAATLARAGLSVTVLEDKDVIGGACRTEKPFRTAPDLGVSTGAYLLGLMPPEILRELDIELPLLRRDPHYFLPTTGSRYVLFGSDAAATRAQIASFFSEQDARAAAALDGELEQLRSDVAPCWLAEPLSIEETAARYLRPALREVFIALCRRPVPEYLDRFGFRSDLLRVMYAVTDGFSGLSAGWDSPGTGMNFLVHNMCRLPGAGGTWMIVHGGMGTVTRTIADAALRAGARIETGRRASSLDYQGGAVRGVVLADGERWRARRIVFATDPWRMAAVIGDDARGAALRSRLGELRRGGMTLKVNLCFDALPVFRCLPEDRGQFRTTIHLLPEENPIAAMRRAFADASAGRLPEFPAIEWYTDTVVDAGRRGSGGHHSGALFVQWVPHELAGGRSWDDALDGYVRHLLSICDRFAPGTSERVVETLALSPPGIERYFGITGGHIHHVDNSFGFADRLPYRSGIPGVYAAGAGCHPAGSVIGAAGRNAARALLCDDGRPSA